ncbi:Glycolate oxidase iron-sulfur subunit [Nymphon striatum]|nr:Glycolate oxidase iron-sulfur subunit [Nymphon striatum]
MVAPVYASQSGLPKDGIAIFLALAIIGGLIAQLFVWIFYASDLFDLCISRLKDDFVRVVDNWLRIYLPRNEISTKKLISMNLFVLDVANAIDRVYLLLSALVIFVVRVAVTAAAKRQWVKLSWDDAVNEIGDKMLSIRDEAIFLIGNFGVLSHTLPGYYGLKTGSWKHWARVWETDYDYLLGQFASKELMEGKGIPVSRWIDARAVVWTFPDPVPLHRGGDESRSNPWLAELQQDMFWTELDLWQNSTASDYWSKCFFWSDYICIEKAQKIVDVVKRERPVQTVKLSSDGALAAYGDGSGWIGVRFQIKDTNDLGELEFRRKCSVCHTLTPDGENRAGPTLYDLFGRVAGTLPDYKYSKALLDTDIKIMSEEFNMSMRKFLKQVGVTSQQEIERIFLHLGRYFDEVGEIREEFRIQSVITRRLKNLLRSGCLFLLPDNLRGVLPEMSKIRLQFEVAPFLATANSSELREAGLKGAYGLANVHEGYVGICINIFSYLMQEGYLEKEPETEEETLTAECDKNKPKGERKSREAVKRERRASFTKAITTAVRVTCKDNRMISNRSASREKISLNAESIPSTISFSIEKLHHQKIVHAVIVGLSRMIKILDTDYDNRTLLVQAEMDDMLARIVTIAKRHKVKVVKESQSATEAALIWKGMSGIIDYEPAEMVMIAKAGTPIFEIEKALAEGGQRMIFRTPRLSILQVKSATLLRYLFWESLLLQSLMQFHHLSQLLRCSDLLLRKLTGKRRSPSPGVFEADKPSGGRVTLLTGCAQPALDAGINKATIELLNRVGVEVVLPEGEGCCGSLVHHMGREHQALDAAKNNVRVWSEEIEAKGLDAIIVTTSGCGTTIKDYGYMLRNDPEWAEPAAKVSSIAMDQIKSPPKDLLKRAGFDVKEAPESHLCCGSAGTYNIMQPEIANQLRDRKVKNIESTKPQAIAAGNIGLPDAIHAAKAAGFDAVECHWPYDFDAEDIKSALEETNLEMLGLNTRRGNVAVGENGLTALIGREAEAKAAIDEAIEYAVAIDAKHIHVMAGVAYCLNKKTIVIEPLNHIDVPGYFLSSTDQAKAIIDEVAMKNLKLMFDCYHVQIMEGDVVSKLRALKPIIGHIQFASVPDRGTPDHGELDYEKIRVQSGSFGACLMREPELVGRCVAAMKEVADVPITVKCRIGVDEQDTQIALDNLSSEVWNCGADALWVHARKAWLEGLSPKENRDIPPLDYDRVYSLKVENTSHFIGINGGVESLNQAKRSFAAL